MKKAILSFNTLQFVYNFLFMIVAVLAIYMLAQSYFRLSFGIIPQESSIFYHAAVYGLSYEDPLTDRVYPGILTAKGLPYEANNIAAKITFGQTVFFHKKEYEEWSTLAHSRIPGQGGATLYSYLLPQALYEGKPVTLNVTAVMRR